MQFEIRRIDGIYLLTFIGGGKKRFTVGLSWDDLAMLVRLILDNVDIDNSE